MLFRYWWAGWLFAGLLVEVVALVDKKVHQGTLSQAVWTWCRVTPGQPWTTWTAFHVLFALAMLWLFVHLVLGYWR